MQALLNNVFFDNISYLYLILTLPIVIACLFSSSTPSRAMAFVLCAMIWAAWQENLWYSPANIIGFHMLLMIVCAFFVSYTQVKILFWIVSLDAAYLLIPELPPSSLFMQFPTHLYWWHTGINLLFLCQLYFAGRDCYNANRGKHNDDSNNDFVAIRIITKDQS